MGPNLVSSYVKSAPKHRAAKAPRAPKAALKTSLTLSSMAVVATGLAVGAGQLAFGGSDTPATTAAADLVPQAAPASAKTSESAAPAKATAAPSAAETESTPIGDSARREVLSRSAARSSTASGDTDDTAPDPAKVDLLSLGSGNAVARTEDMSGEDPHAIAQALLSSYGWSQDQYSCLDSLWTRESGWNPSADNPSSSAYGIPQALPGSKMASAGADWATNPVTQIRWGLGYIAERYGSPCSAWGHSQATGFY